MLQDDKASWYFDDEKVSEVKIPPKPRHGFVAYGALSYGLADYDNLRVLESPHHDADLVRRRKMRKVNEMKKFWYLSSGV